jgi:flagellar hook-length control protein FliK/D-aminopeptidase
MSISAGIINNLNPDVNICSLIQLIGAGVAEQTTGKESCDENGNSFICLMQQTLSELLQYDYSEQSTETLSNLKMSESPEQLHQETSKAEENQMTPGFAMILPAGKTDILVQAKVEEMQMMEPGGGKENATGLSAEVAVRVGNIRNVPAHILSGYEEIETVETKETMAAKVETAPLNRPRAEVRTAEDRQVPKKNIETVPIRNVSAHILSGYEEIETVETKETLTAKVEAEPAGRQTVAVRDSEDRQAPKNNIEPAPIRNVPAHILSGYEEIETVETKETLTAKVEAEPAGRQTVSVRDSEDRQAPKNNIEPAPIRNVPAHILSGYEEIETEETKETMTAKVETVPLNRPRAEVRTAEDRQVPKKNIETVPIRNVSAHVLTGYEEIETEETKETLTAKVEAEPAGRQTVAVWDSEDRQAPKNNIEPAPIRNVPAHILSGYEEIELSKDEPGLQKRTADVFPGQVKTGSHANEEDWNETGKITKPVAMSRMPAVDPETHLARETIDEKEIKDRSAILEKIVLDGVAAFPRRDEEKQSIQEDRQKIRFPRPVENNSLSTSFKGDLSGANEDAETKTSSAHPFSGQTDLVNSGQKDVKSAPEDTKEQFDKAATISESRQGSRETALFSSTAVREHSHRAPTVAEDRHDLKMNAVLQEKAGQKEENAMSGDQEMPFADKQQAQVRHDAKNYAEKNVPAGTEFSAVMGKMKMENKAKAMPGDKNPEMNISGSATSAGVSSRASGAEINPSQIINRVASEFRENISDEGGRIKIILAPPSLGTLEMDVAVYHSKVRVLLMAENQDVQKMLSGNIDALKGALQNQGLNIDRCDVLTQDRKEHLAQHSGQEAFYRESDRRGQNESNEYRRRETAEVLVRKVKPSPQEARSSGKISLFA